MMATLKAEFRKMLTVRSTYIVTALAMVLVIFFAFYIEGFKLSASDLHNPLQLASDVTGAVSAVAVFGAIVAILLLTHEYRYSTIMYTLTASNSRSKVLFAKIVVVTTYAVVFTLIVSALSPAMSYLGVHMHGQTLVPQTLHYSELLWHTLFYGWGMAMAGLLFATLIRSQVGAIAAIFVVPGIVEQLLGLLLKKNTVYLPFNALDQLLGQNTDPSHGILSPGKAAGVFGIYLVVGWIVAWVLFLKRDAN